ncbi:MAG: hypothetical protein JJU21_04440 [Salinarimonas sp.]|nr:hypothetical protein [Salinarimonas sp.]
MKKLACILTGTACLAAMSLASQARADESCNIGAHSVESFSQEYFVNPQARHVTPLLAIEDMLENGCSDENEFARVIEIYSDDRVADIYQRSDPNAWRVDRTWMHIGMEMLMLGHEAPLRNFLETARADAESGDPGAMAAFAYLARHQTDHWDWTNQFRAYERDFPLAIAHLGLEEWGERDTHPIRSIAPRLRNEGDAFVERASEAGFGPAHSMYLASQQPAGFTPCRATTSLGGSGLFGMVDDPDADDTPTNRFIEAFVDLPDREQVARDLMDWSRDVIKASIDRGQPYLLTPDIEAAANLAQAYAGIRSNCALSIERSALDFGIEDRDEAAIGLNYAIVAPGALFQWGLALVYASFVDQFYDSPDRHYAAARFLQAGGYIETLEHHNESVDAFVEDLSRETVREAQRIMAEYGYYTSTIDGIPGPNFRNGLMQWTSYCRTDFGQTPDKCIRTGPYLLDHDWARPFLGEVAQLR